MTPILLNYSMDEKSGIKAGWLAVGRLHLLSKQ